MKHGARTAIIFAFWFTAIGNSTMGPRMITRVGPYGSVDECQKESDNLEKAEDIEKPLQCLPGGTHWFTAVGNKARMGPTLILRLGPYSLTDCESEQKFLVDNGYIQKGLPCSNGSPPGVALPIEHQTTDSD